MRKIASFDCQVIEGSGTTLLILHGYGADFKDLAPLSSAINTNEKCRWVFPNGPLQVPIGPAWMGRAWFPIDIEALESALAQGNYRDMTDMRPQHLDVIRQKVIDLANTLVDNSQELVIGGFSQGAMLAMDVALNLEKPPKGLVLWSGALVNKTEWTEKMNSLKGVPVFQSHGSTDPMLDPKGAQQLSELMKTSGCKNEFYGFEGGHEIPIPIIEKTSEFLKKIGC